MCLPLQYTMQGLSLFLKQKILLSQSKLIAKWLQVWGASLLGIDKRLFVFFHFLK